MAQKVREIAGALSPEKPGSRASIREKGRLAALAGGGMLTLMGLVRRSPLGGIMALTGGYLVYRNAVQQRSAPGRPKPLRAKRSITINKSAEELYNFWRDLANLPRFMKHLEAVEMMEDGRSCWIANVPLGPKVEWYAEIADEKPNEMIAWRSLPGSDMDASGMVRFQPAPGGRGTEVHLTFEYKTAGGATGDTFTRFYNEITAEIIENELRRFKQLMETGEIATTEGQPSGRAEDRHLTGKRMQEETERWKPQGEDEVTEASWESYPASDPPSWIGQRPGGEPDL